MIGSWTCERPEGRTSKELAVQITPQVEADEPTLLILPALFDEANKLRRYTIEVMRRLSEAGIGSVLPDFPGMNESMAPLSEQGLTQWREDAEQAAQQFGASHVLTIRGSALFAPQTLPAWHYAPAMGPRILRNMLRAQVLALRETGQQLSIDELGERGAAQGIELAGWQFGPQLFSQLQEAEPLANPAHAIIEQSEVGGAGLWLRAEPDDNADQVAALADIIAAKITAR